MFSYEYDANQAIGYVPNSVFEDWASLHQWLMIREIIRAPDNKVEVTLRTYVTPTGKMLQVEIVGDNITSIINTSYLFQSTDEIHK
tara:strand:+ start:3063 stop:3320 length:258 start_codon:yes stop_codon:yes gene_type:complete